MRLQARFLENQNFPALVGLCLLFLGQMSLVRDLEIDYSCLRDRLNGPSFSPLSIELKGLLRDSWYSFLRGRFWVLVCIYGVLRGLTFYEISTLSTKKVLKQTSTAFGQLKCERHATDCAILILCDKPCGGHFVNGSRESFLSRSSCNEAHNHR